MFKITSMQNCPGNQSMLSHVNINETTGVSSRIIYSGYFDVLKNISGQLALSIEANRCDSGMTKCEKQPTIKFTDICKRLNDKKAFYYDAVRKTKPPFVCPIKADRYVIQNASVDFSILALLPLSGFHWYVDSCT